MEYKVIYNLRVLYVEDEDDTLDPMSRFLQRRFSKTVTAKNGEEGWKKFNEYHPDIIITDLLLPEYGGIEMIEKIRKTGYSNPIIITSALQDVSSIVKTFDLGISKYIIKPIDMDVLDAALERYVHEVISKNRPIFNLPIPEKKKCELNISRIISSILKKYTGKGPKDVKVFIGTDQIEITCMNVLTLYEITLLQSGKNAALVEQNRRLFYQILRKEIEIIISQQINVNVTVKDISIDSHYDMDVIHLIST